MFKLVIVTCFLSLSLASTNNVEIFYGKWFAVATFRNVVDFVSCANFIVTDGGGKVQCNCNGVEKEVSLIDIETEGFQDKTKFALIPKDSTEQITPDLYCNCGKYQPVLIWFKVNDNYLVGYENQKGATYTEKERYTAYIFTRHVPTFSELKDFIAEREDLKDREVEFPCKKLRP